MKYKLLAFLFLFGVIEFNAQTTIDCLSGPLNVSYCYENDDVNSVTYTSSDGSSLRLVIVSGTVENNFDELIILDSDGITDLNEATPYGQDGDITGMSFVSSGDSISFLVDSDGSVSCATGNLDATEYQVVCSTCANPQATFEEVSDCNNGDQFLVNIDVTNLGDATSLNMSNSLNANTSTISAIGTYQVGPFSISEQVMVTLQNNQDVNCSITSSELEFLYCPPVNDDPCDAIVLTTGNDQCNLFSSGTIAGATDSGVAFPVCQSNANDDVWFQFTATTESQIVSIQNVTAGTFNLDHAVYEGSCDNLTELYCTENPDSVAAQLIIGDTYFVRVFSFGLEPETSNFDICLSDAPANVICEEAVPFCTGNGTLITNNTTGIQGLSDIACLGSAPNPKWSVIQIGESGTIEIEIEQTEENGNLLDVDFVVWGPFADIQSGCAILEYGCPTSNDCPNNTNNPTFYPYGNIIDCSYSVSNIENFNIDDAQAGEIYILLVTNYSDQPGIVSITQTNLNQAGSGSLTAEVEADLGPDLNICESDNNSVILGSESTFADNYEWYFNGFFMVSGPDLSSYTATQSGVYSVYVYNENCDVTAQDDILVSFVNCDDVGLINVNAFYDANDNGVFDTNETSFSNGYFTYEINDDTIINTVSSSTGSFTLASEIETDTYDFNYYFYDEYEDCYDVSTAVFENISVLTGENVTVDFPIVDEQSCEDIAVYLINQQAPRPGFFHNNYLVIDNLGLFTTSGSIEYILDPGLTINTTSTAGNYTITSSANGFVLDFLNLLSGQNIVVTIVLQTPVTTNIGDYVTNTATYITAENDIVPDNDSSSITELVIGSYDPNDKMESHGREILYADFVTSDEYLYYTIRFQNLGTAEAVFVRIEDALDVQLDETTFQMLRSSHDYVVTRTDNNLEWVFDNINLPAEQDDADGSIGYVYFKIKPKTGYAIGDIIPNSSAIYFDFNAPIITNTFETEFVEELLSVSEFDFNDFEVFPNPAKDKFTVKLNTSINGTLSVYDIQGKLILDQNVTESNLIEMNVSQLQNGMYFIKLKSDQFEAIKKLIIE
ncbi:DUF7619 domain-containing protein [Psychroserpens jangbogonensis]|uniref:DUF7619 domain-containing protein n=1 Tax=Psychroserpens jangbogonensis TaxID=1484460 RepID=UPI00053D13F5|nr:T9SS type A sorting domain-containing protein [Psychroserpens jangbogonensis]